MFFFLSKILAFLTSPLIWILTLLIWSVFTNIERRKKILLYSAMISLYFFSNMFIAAEFLRLLEYRYEKIDYAPEQDNTFDYAVVLGGMTWYNEKLEKPQFQRSADRLFQALWLLKQKKVKKIIFTGGSGSISFANHKEGMILKRWLNQVGFPDSCFVFENESKNTRENALFTKSILEKLNYKNKKVALVTSAFHMRRAMACFKKVGVENLTPYITDGYAGERKFEWDHCFIPTAEAWQRWDLIIHETVGLLMYKIMGYC
jgi:uncharacterized SAM-binding protein YcdF (DUF218 family)